MKVNKLFSALHFSGVTKIIKALIRYPREHPLGKRVLTSILFCSTCMAFLATGVQLLMDYRHDISKIESRMREIENSYIDGVGASLWNMDDTQTRQLLEGFAKLPDIRQVQLKDSDSKVVFEFGLPMQDKFKTIVRQIPINYAQDGSKNKTFLGTLVLTASLERIYKELQDRVLIILITQTTKTTIVAIFILFIFRYLVSRHLYTLADFARKLDINHINLTEKLKLGRPAQKHPDELDVVVGAINGMAQSIRHDMKELEIYRNKLEDLVKQRTEELGDKVIELQTVVQKLNKEMKERKQAEQTALDNEERYRQVVEMSPDAIMIERGGKIVFANKGTLKLLGATDASQILGMSILQLVALEWHDLMLDSVLRMPGREEEMRAVEGKLMRFDGTSIDVELSRAAFQYEGGMAIQTVAHDITKHKHYEERLRRQALHDGLTGLPNRILLMDRLKHAIAHADRQKYSIAVLFIDLDRFKYVNDTLGHDSGDELLKIITARINECIRKCDTLARLGGDEFVLLIGEVANEEMVSTLVQRVMSAVSQPLMLGEQEVSVTCSIGMSVYPQDGKDPVTLLKFADTAMYGAKEQGRNTIQRYTAEMHMRANEHLVMEAHLRRALERKEFILHYQPQIDLRTGKICGVEALIRWQHPELGLVAPLRFIPLAEEIGLIRAIGKWVTREACFQIRAWQRAGLEPIKVAVNLSSRQMVRPDLEMEVEEALQDAEIAPQYLELEITESMSMDHPDRTIAIFTKLKSMGISIAIDDFGTGYSNLTYLRNFPVDRIKLDRAFVRDIIAAGTHKKGDTALASSIISMGHSLQLKVVAEGVEEVEQLTQLIACGCDEMQGYYFSKPLPAENITQMLREDQTLDLSICFGQAAQLIT